MRVAVGTVVIASARAEDARAPLVLASGLALTLGLVAGSFASFGIEFGATGWLRTMSAAIMVVVGLAMLVPALGIGQSISWHRLLGFQRRSPNDYPRRE